MSEQTKEKEREKESGGNYSREEPHKIVKYSDTRPNIRNRLRSDNLKSRYLDKLNNPSYSVAGPNENQNLGPGYVL